MGVRVRVSVATVANNISESATPDLYNIYDILEDRSTPVKAILKTVI